METFIKGFDKDLKCRGYQFEIGKTYDTGYTENLKLCTDTVFHFCRGLEQIHNHYSVRGTENRFCEIEVLGGLVEDDDKCGSNKIRIVREIKGEELANLKGLVRGNTGFFNTGERNTGNYNTGDRNTGYYNTGNYNTGNYNTGDRNTGDYNTGDRNTGYFNKCDHSTGFFNTKERNITLFNKDSGMTYEEFRESIYSDAIYSVDFTLTKWVYYTDKEKENSPVRQAMGGYLKKYSYFAACLNWWKDLSEENKEIIQSIPNFDKEIFKEITGIEL